MAGLIAEVIPLRRFQRTKGIFDYLVPSGLTISPGDVVAIPFLKSTMPGLVINLANKNSDRPLKQIAKLLRRQALTREQLALIDWLANYSAVSIASAANIFKLDKYVTRTQPAAAPPMKKKVLAQPQPQLNLVVSSNKQVRQLVDSLVNKVLARQQQVLLLVPEQYTLTRWQAQLAVKPEVIYHSRLSRPAAAKVWESVRLARSKFIIGTRAALWLPYLDLGGIIITQAESESYFQSEQNPRYDALAAATQLAKIWHAALAKISVAPRLESWYAAKIKQEKWQIFSNPAGSFSVLDVGQQPPGAKAEALTDAVVSAINRSMARKEKILLYLNKRGEASFSQCQDCGYIAICANCRRPLASLTDGKSLFCFHCNLEVSAAIPCPKCDSLRINYKGYGLSKLFRVVRKIWPREKVCLLEGKLNKKLLQQAAESNMIIGNRTAVRALDFTSLGLSVLIRPDIELNLPEFRSVERLWQLARHLQSVSRQLIVQTQFPEHYLWRALKQNRADDWYANELKQRRLYNYPPFSKLLRLSVSEPSQELACAQAQALKKLLRQNGFTREIIGPYQNYFGVRHKKWVYHILLKLPPDFQTPALWPILPAEVIVEADPWLVLS
jgi:primosomal protein N' (replication factor Y)